MNPNRQLQDQGHGVRDGLLYLLVGGGIGAALALLFAPKSGAELRTDLSDLTRKGYDGTLELAGSLKTQSSEILHTLAEKKDQVLDLAASRFGRAETGVDNAVNSVEDKINGAVRQLDEAAPKTPTPGRKSSDIL